MLDWILITLAVCLIFSPENGDCCGRPEETGDSYFLPSQNRYSEGSRVKYFCNEGFSLKVIHEMQKYNHCIKGRWNNPSPPKCVKNPSCGEPGTPENSVSTLDEDGITVKYNCKPGYVMAGNSVRTCSSNTTWTPQEMPKCFTNLAYQKPFLQYGVTGSIIVNHIVNSSNCEAQVIKNNRFHVFIDLGHNLSFSNILISLKIENRRSEFLLKASSFSENWTEYGRLLDHLNADKSTSQLWFNTTSARLEIARYILIQQLISPDYEIYVYKFAICEIQVFNLFESLGCGNPDEPLNGFAVNVSNSGFIRYHYWCNRDYALEGTALIECIDGQWSAPPIMCNPLPDRPAIETRPNLTTTKQVVDYEDNSKENLSVTTFAIAIGTVASVLVISAVIGIVVVVTERSNSKKTHSQPVQVELGQLPNIPVGHLRSQEVNQLSHDDPPIHFYESVRDPIRPPLPVPRSPLSSSGSSHQYQQIIPEPTMPLKTSLVNPYDDLDHDPVTSEQNESNKRAIFCPILKE